MRVKIEIDGKTMVDMESNVSFFSVGSEEHGNVRTGLVGSTSPADLSMQLAASLVSAIKALDSDVSVQKHLVSAIALGMIDGIEEDDSISNEEPTKNRLREYLN